LRHFKHANSGYIMPEIKFIKANGVYKRNYSFRIEYYGRDL